jgi:nitrite reductase/ring-hydroxylating ferredoxin subunit
MLLHGLDGQYHAFRNRCPHKGRRLDPVDKTAKVQCCCLSRSTFDYSGNVMSGPCKTSLRKYRVRTNKCKIVIGLD